MIGACPPAIVGSAYVTTTPPDAGGSSIPEGHVTVSVGIGGGLTVTVNDPDADCRSDEVAVTKTVVVPNWNTDPDAGSELIEMGGKPPIVVGDA